MTKRFREDSKRHVVFNIDKTRNLEDEEIIELLQALSNSELDRVIMAAEVALRVRKGDK